MTAEELPQRFAMMPMERWWGKVSEREEFSASFAEVESLLDTAEAGVLAVGAYQSTDAWIYGLGLWLRALEGCRATLLIADQGLFGAALATTRTSLECLFYGCALWRDPSLFQLWKDTHTSESHKQASAIKGDKGSLAVLNPEHQEFIDKAAAVEKPKKTLDAFLAAQHADLVTMYHVAYRGCSAGAHASFASVDAHVVKQEGFNVISCQSGTVMLPVVLEATKLLLMTGMARMREQLSDPRVLQPIPK